MADAVRDRTRCEDCEAPTTLEKRGSSQGWSHMQQSDRGIVFLTTNAFSIATKEMVFCLVDVLLRKMVIVIEFNVPLLHALNKYYLNQ